MSDVGKLTEQEAYELAEILKQKLASSCDSNQSPLDKWLQALGTIGEHYD